MDPNVARATKDALFNMTLLTFDPQAGRAYLYLRPPATFRPADRTFALNVSGEANIGAFTAIKDFDKSLKPLGIEFPARDSQEAFARAAFLFSEYR